MSKKDPGVVVATTSFTVGDRTVAKGETFREGHSIVEGREELFEPFTVDNEIEQATAAPGEKRGRKKAKRGRKKAKSEAQSSTGSSAGGGATNYADLKQPQLKQLLDERGIEYKKGPVANAKLVELLEAADKASE